MVFRYLAFVLLVFCWTLQGSGSVSLALAAECTETSARLAMHLTTPTSKIPCGPSTLSCSSGNLVTQGSLDQEYRAYVLLVRGEPETGLIEIEIGVEYNPEEGVGVDVLEFQSCASTVTPIGDWPASGSRLRMTYAGCLTPLGPDPIVLGWFRVIAHTSGSLTLGSSQSLSGTPGTVNRLVDCDLEEKIIDPVNQGAIWLGSGGGGFDPCSSIADAFEGPCCFQDSCQEAMTVGCCWAAGGYRLEYTANCNQCITQGLPGTWGGIKARYQ